MEKETVSRDSPGLTGGVVGFVHHPFSSQSRSNNYHSEGYKGIPPRSRDFSSIVIGELEFKVLEYVYENGLRYFTPSEIVLYTGKDKRRIGEALKRLVNRGILKKLRRGIYALADQFRGLGLEYFKVKKTENLKSPFKKKQNTSEEKKDSKSEQKTEQKIQGLDNECRGPSSASASGGVCGGGFLGLFFDNVMWFGGGGFRRMGRGLLWGVLPSGVLSYSEVAGVVSGVSGLDGVFVCYSSGEDVARFGCGDVLRCEWRPYSGVVRGVSGWRLRAMYWERVLVVFRALLRLVSGAPAWVRRGAWRVLWSEGRWLVSGGGV